MGKYVLIYYAGRQRSCKSDFEYNPKVKCVLSIKLVYISQTFSSRSSWYFLLMKYIILHVYRSNVVK